MATHADAQPTCRATAQTPDVPFMPFLTGLATWSLLKFAAEYIVRRVNPQFFEDLKMNARRKYDLYFGTWLGTIFKIVSITACTASLFTTSAETDIVGLVRPLNTAEQWCWGCRAIIYTQEIPHIASIPELVIHHVLSIGAMLAILAFNIPRRQLYIAWAGLLSEFVSNARRLLKMHSRLSPRLGWWLTAANVLLILVFRVTGCFVALVWTLQSGTRGVSLVIDVGSWTIYLIYMLHVSISEASRSKLVTFDAKPPAIITVAETFHVSPRGLILGISCIATELSAIFLYEFTGNRISSLPELHSIAWVALQAVTAGLIGSYVTLLISKPFSLTFNHDAAEQERLSMKGGFLFAAITLAVSPTMDNSTVHTPSLVACTTISWTLLKAIDHVGQYLEGGEPDTTPRILHLDLIASLLGGISYLYLVVAVLSGSMASLYQAAVLAACLEITIGSVISPRRTTSSSTNKRLSLSGGWHFIQIVGCILLLAYMPLLEEVGVTGSLINTNDYFSVLGGVLVRDVQTPFRWGATIAGWRLIFEVVASYLSRPKGSTARSPSSGGKKRGGGGGGRRGDGKSKEGEGATTTATSTKGFAKRLNLKFLASISGVSLVLLMIWATYVDIMPKAITEVESATTGERALGGERFQFVLEAVSSWQVVGSMAVVAGLPVVLLQVMD